MALSAAERTFADALLNARISKGVVATLIEVSRRTGTSLATMQADMINLVQDVHDELVVLGGDSNLDV